MRQPNALMIGTGEYTTGFVHDKASGSDKAAGVVALTLFDLRRRGLVDQLSMAGVRGTKFPAIRAHIERAHAAVYERLDTSFKSFPADDVARDESAYLSAMDELQPGDLVTVFTPDDQHFAMAMAAVERGLHVLIAKPLVKTLAEHLDLADAAREKGVLVAMEVHKRWDPIYVDARDQIRQLGDFSFFTSYMSQPKKQLDSFRNWAGKSSDISYYLNAHHIDFNVWAAGHRARPISVTALASTGVAKSLGIETEDTITLSVQWKNLESGGLASAFYTSSWIAPPSDVHSQQRFFYMGAGGEIQVDQAHRGYSFARDESRFASPNPLFMKYAPNAQGEFGGQQGYGYRSIEAFVQAVASINNEGLTPEDVRGDLAVIDDVVGVTAILEAGRRSLDSEGRAVELVYDEEGSIEDLQVVGEPSHSSF